MCRRHTHHLVKAQGHFLQPFPFLTNVHETNNSKIKQLRTTCSGVSFNGACAARAESALCSSQESARLSLAFNPKHPTGSLLGFIIQCGVSSAFQKESLSVATMCSHCVDLGMIDTGWWCEWVGFCAGRMLFFVDKIRVKMHDSAV